MCQLTFINVNSNKNRFLLYQQLALNTRTSHRDGTGFYQKDSGLFKTKESVPTFIQLPEKIMEVITNNNPIIAHVRLCTNKTLVTDDRAHPFETDKLVFAHNGTLSSDICNKAENKDLIDSQVFLKELNNAYDGTNIIDALNNTMKQFTGPFAFLIYSKIENRYFAVRGTTKKLYSAKFIINGKNGIIINTDSDDLRDNLIIAKNTFFLNNINMSYSDPILIPEKTINEIDIKHNKIIEIGKIEEYTTPVRVYNATPAAVSHTVDNKEVEDDLTKAFNNILNCMIKAGMSLIQLDNLVYELYDCGIVYLGESDYYDLADVILPKFMEYYSDTKYKFWKKLCDTETETDKFIILNKYKLEFPYFLNKTQRLKSAYKQARAEFANKQTDPKFTREF